MILEALAGAGDRVTSAIRSASRTTGQTFDYLLRTAIRESSLDPTAAAKTSSARGLYQFIESTWLAMVKEEGPKYGLGGFAAAIERGPGGQYHVRDPAARAHILKLREDPEISSVMAGALATRNAGELARSLGRRPTGGELYVAHFLGASGAKRLIALQHSNPNTPAATAFPDAARANRSVFYGSDGAPRSASEVLAVLSARHDNTPKQPPLAVPLAFAQLRPTLSPDPVTPPERVAAERVIYDHPVAPRHTAFAAEEGPAFETLFRTGAYTPGALSPSVRELWGGAEARRTAAGEASAPDTRLSAPGGVGGPLNLLDHLKPSVIQSGRRTRL